jgi:protein ImuA
MALRPEPPSPVDAPRLLDRLRQELLSAERATGLVSLCNPPLAIGIAVIDTALGGGLACGALHEIAATRESETAVATGFALALAVRNGRKSRPGRSGSREQISPLPQTVLWIAEDLSLAENGQLYGPGLDQAGIAPEHLITVSAPRARDVLWAMEEALRCRALGVVIGEIRARGIEHVTTRRLSLAAAAGNTLGFLLRTLPDDEPSACATRWTLAAAPSDLPSPRFHDIGPPRWTVHLTRNRRGHSGIWIVEWNSVEQRFELAKNSQPVAATALDRPYRTTAA